MIAKGNPSVKSIFDFGGDLMLQYTVRTEPFVDIGQLTTLIRLPNLTTALGDPLFLQRV